MASGATAEPRWTSGPINAPIVAKLSYSVAVDPRREMGAFLTSRRAKLSPKGVKLTARGATRRVPGLRRSEVAVLAGISCEYYTRLEQGRIGTISDSVLDAVAMALQLDEAEYAHLTDLVQATGMRRRPRHIEDERPRRRNTQHVLNAISAPALLHNTRMDILSANELGRALHSPMFAGPDQPPNHARFLFLDPCAREFYAEWDVVAGGTVPLLRTEHARNPNDDALSELISELIGRSEPFRAWWETHDVRFYNSSALVRLHHPVVGDLELTFEALEVVADRRLTINMFIAEPRSPTERALSSLAHSSLIAAT
jgi:transcriptional regulator with XRE-family HTH domain